MVVSNCYTVFAQIVNDCIEKVTQLSKFQYVEQIKAAADHQVGGFFMLLRGKRYSRL